MTSVNFIIIVMRNVCLHKQPYFLLVRFWGLQHREN